jgi:hypothetical protein
MSYNFELAVSTSVDAPAVEAMLKSIIEAQTGRKIASMSCRYEGTTFNGYDVHFENEVTTSEKKKASFTDKAFKPFVWQ